MTDTHAMSERTYTVTERIVDCDGSCIGPGDRPESTVAWDGLPPRLRDLIWNALSFEPLEQGDAQGVFHA